MSSCLLVWLTSGICLHCSEYAELPALLPRPRAEGWLMFQGSTQMPSPLGDVS